MSKRFIHPVLTLTLVFIMCANTTAIAGINTLGSPGAFTSCSGTASAAQNFAVSGTSLLSNLVITAPSGFEISLSSGSGYAGSLSLTPASGTVNNTIVYVRLDSSATGTPSGNIVCTASGALPQNVPVSGAVTSISTSVFTQNDVSCFGGTNGGATIQASGGTGKLSYAWAPYGGTGATAYGLSVGKFTCSVSDINSCVKTQSVSINQPPAITTTLASQTNIPCFGGSSGTTTVTASGGAGGFNYYWSPTGATTPTDSGLIAGTYICYIGDANDCGTQVNVTITQGTAINTSIISQNNVPCFGNSTGAATISASGGTGTLTYFWSPSGGTSRSATGLTGGNYTCRVTDQNNCSVSQPVSITEPVAGLTVSIDSTFFIKCHGETNGAIYTTVTGGTKNYTYHWNNNSNTSNLTGIGAGIYMLQVTDHNGCTAQSTIDTLTQPSALVVLADSVKPVTCAGGNDGAINITASGSVSGYTYAWPGGIHTQNITSLSTGNYTVTVTDHNSCNATSTTHIGYMYELPTVTLNLAFETLCTNAGTQALTGESPTGGTFSGTGVQSHWFTPSVTGADTITYTYTDSHGCTNNATAGIMVSVCTGIKEVANGSISLYPNPATSSVNLKTDGLKGKLLLQIYDNLGRLIREINGPLLTGSDVTTINVEDLVPAHYFIRATADETQTTFNIVIQR